MWKGGIANPQLTAAELQIRLNRGTVGSAEQFSREQNPRQISCNNPKESSVGMEPSQHLFRLSISRKQGSIGQIIGI